MLVLLFCVVRIGSSYRKGFEAPGSVRVFHDIGASVEAETITRWKACRVRGLPSFHLALATAWSQITLPTSRSRPLRRVVCSPRILGGLTHVALPSCLMGSLLCIHTLQVVDGLYLGGMEDAVDVESIVQHNVIAVLNVSGELCRPTPLSMLTPLAFAGGHLLQSCLSLSVTWCPTCVGCS